MNSPLESFLAFALLLLGTATSAAACSVKPDLRTFDERVRDRPLVFIGVVTSIDVAAKPPTATFQLEHALVGTPETSRNQKGILVTLPLSKPSTCTIAFKPGERWFYAGDSVNHPSRRLASENARESDDLSAVMTRVDDQSMNFPPAWQACRDDSQCTALPYGCSATAAASAHLDAARSHAWKIGGDPRAINCHFVVPPPWLRAPLCVAGRCGLWTLNRG